MIVLYWIIIFILILHDREDYNIWEIFGSVNRAFNPRDSTAKPTWSREVKAGGYIVGYQKGFNVPGQGSVQYDYKVDPVMTYYMNEPIFKREGHTFGTTANTTIPTHFKIQERRSSPVTVPVNRPDIKTIINRTPITHDLMHTLRNSGYTGTYADGPHKARQWMLNKYNIK